MTRIVHGFYVWGLAGGSVLGLLLIFAVVLSLTFAIADRVTAVVVRIRQRRARARFTREAREAAVERMLTRYRHDLMARGGPLPAGLVERILAGVDDELQRRREQQATPDGADTVDMTNAYGEDGTTPIYVPRSARDRFERGS